MPWSRSSSSHASTAPGIAAASPPAPGTRSSPSARKCSMVAPAGAGPWPMRTTGAAGRLGGGEDADQVAAGAVQVRLDDVQHEPAGDGRVERVAAALEHGLRGGRGEPVGRRGHAERAPQRGARREGRGRSEGHCGPARRRSIHASTSSAVRGIAAERFSAPSAVTRMSSSMRTPMPRYSSGTVRSSIWK